MAHQESYQELALIQRMETQHIPFQSADVDKDGPYHLELVQVGLLLPE